MRPPQIVSVVLLLASGCGKDTDEGERWSAPGDADAAYASLLGELSARFRERDPQEPASHWGGEKTPAKTLVIKRRVEPIDREHKRAARAVFWGRLKKELPLVKREAYDDFWVRNEDPKVPVLTAAGDCRIEYAEDAELDRLGEGAECAEEWWCRVLERYPRSRLVGLSAMGFSRDGKQGLVYVAFPGWFGAYYVVAKSGGRWRIVEEWRFWTAYD